MQPDTGLAPVADEQARVLILGSMPGKASLLARQYYAHPRNTLWRLLGEIYQFNWQAEYVERCASLINAKVALWDVLKTCTRTSSLDSDIVESSIVANDIGDFLSRHPDIRHIYFNGAKAQQIFQRHIEPDLTTSQLQIPTRRLPSTSPANASLTTADKLKAWSVLTGPG